MLSSLAAAVDRCYETYNITAALLVMERCNIEEMQTQLMLRDITICRKPIRGIRYHQLGVIPGCDDCFINAVLVKNKNIINLVMTDSVSVFQALNATMTDVTVVYLPSVVTEMEGI